MNRNTPLLRSRLVTSGFVQAVRLDTGNFLCVHAISQARVVLKPDVVEVLNAFAEPTVVGDWLDQSCPPGDPRRAVLLQALSSLVERRFLYAGTREEEQARFAALLSQWYGRDPDEARRADRRWRQQAIPRFAAPTARGLDSFAPLARRLDVVVIGLCEVQIGLDVFREEARALGVDLHLVPTFDTTLETLSETAHDAIVVGPLGQRHGDWHQADGGGDLWPERYEGAARDLLYRVRALSPAPILLHNLPVPTCSLLGHGDRGLDTPVERAREINRRLVALAASFPDVYVVDVEGALASAGKQRLLDDRVMSGSHLGGLGWWTLLPDVELKNVHGLRPPLERLGELGVTDPFEFDRVVARAQLSLLSAIFGVGRREAIILRLDGLLWPGDLTATRAPFPAGLDYGTWSFHSFYVGIQEALKGLRARGIGLAALTGGDEASVRAWWRYPGKPPLARLLLPEDFEALRFGVTDFTEAVRALAGELEADVQRAVLVSERAADRDAAAAAFPTALVFGDNLFAVRGALLTHPALQRVRQEQEGIEYPAMMVALARREQARKAAGDDTAFRATLGVRCTVRRGLPGHDVDRACELVARTRQFTTTGRVFAREALTAGDDASRRVYSLRVEDRFADYGLVGLAVALGDTIELFLLSCRVVGLGVQSAFLRFVVQDLARYHESVGGRLLLLEHNAAARGLFRANGFTETIPGMWRITREQIAAFGPGREDEEFEVEEKGECC